MFIEAVQKKKIEFFYVNIGIFVILEPTRRWCKFTANTVKEDVAFFFLSPVLSKYSKRKKKKKPQKQAKQIKTLPFLKIN